VPPLYDSMVIIFYYFQKFILRILTRKTTEYTRLRAGRPR